MGRKFHLQTGVTGPANAWSPLHYVPLRLACGNPSIPGRRFVHRANRALVFSAFFCFRRLEPTLAFDGCSLRFYLFQYPCAVLYTAQTALLLFSAFFCPRRLEPTLAFAGCSLRFYLFQYPCAVLYAAQTAHLLFSLSSVLGLSQK